MSNTVKILALILLTIVWGALAFCKMYKTAIIISTLCLGITLTLKTED